MASEIEVQTLKGPSGGANADTVLIPSGHTLHAPGHVIQVVNVETSSTVTITAGYSTFTNILSGSITPKSANSKILVQAVLPNYSFNSASNAWSNSCYIRLYEKEGSNAEAVAAGFEHPGPQLSQEFSQVIPILWTSQSKSTVQQYTYSLKAAPTVGGDTHYFGRSTGGYYAYSRMILMEIAQ